MNSIVTRKILFSVVGLLISCVYTLIYFQHYTPSYFDIQVLGGFALLQLIFVYVSWYNLTQSLLNSYIIFITAFYTFNISQPIIEFLGISIEYRRLIYNYIAENHIMMRHIIPCCFCNSFI